MRTRLLLRQATSSIGATLAIAVIVAIAAGLFTAWPRLARTTFVDEFNYRIELTSASARALSAEQTGGYPVVPMLAIGYDQSWDVLNDLADSAGETLAPRLGRPELLIGLGSAETGDVPFEGTTPRPRDLAGVSLSMRAIDSIGDHVRIEDGEAPTVWERPLFEEQNEPPPPAEPVPVMFSVATAERLGVAVGDVLTLAGPTVTDADGTSVPLTAVVTGTFEATDPDEEYWQHQISGLEPLIRTDPNAGDFAIGAAYIHPDSAISLLTTDLVPRTDVWIPVDSGAQDAAALLDDLREITAREITLGDPISGGASLRLSSAVTDVLSQAITAQRGTAAVLGLVAAGPVGVTFALLALATRLSVSRRQNTLALASARGGSPRQIRGGLGLEGLVVGLPAAALGAAIATVAVPGTLQLGDYVLAALAGLAPAVFLAGESLPNLRAQRHDLSGRSQSRWRWVVEVLVVAVAAGAVYLLLSRGLQRTTTTTVDPLATGAPLLVSLAVAVLATRAFPYPMRLVHTAMRRRRDLPGFLGSARAIREGAAGIVPMLALLVATSIAVFSVAMLTTLTGGVQESTRAGTGADVRLVGPPYFDETVEQIAEVPGVATVARVLTQNQTSLTQDDVTRQVTLYAVDTAALGAVQDGVVGAVTLPAGMDELVDGAVPVLTSQTLDSPNDVPASIVMNGTVPAHVVGTAASAAGLAERSTWAIVDLALMREVTGQNLVPRMLLIDLDPDADVDAAVAAISTIVDGQGTIASAQSREAGFLESPSAAAMQQGFVVALVLGVLQSMLALVLTLVLAAPARGRLVAVLRTLGLGARDARRLISWELVPLAAVAVVAGLGLGLALPHLVVATVDLSAFTGQQTPLVRYDWPLLGLVVAGVVSVIALTLLVASAIARRLSLSVLRIGDAS